jgi:hypothetical protein
MKNIIKKKNGYKFYFAKQRLIALQKYDFDYEIKKGLRKKVPLIDEQI